MAELTVQEIKDMMAETAESQKETARQMKESDRRAERRMEEFDRQMKESDRRAERRGKKIDRRLRELNELFTSQWGKLIESLVKGDLVKLLNKRGIAVDNILVRREAKDIQGKPMAEFDLIACNGTETVVIEVKTTLRVRDVDHFLNSMKLFRTAMPRFQNDIIYGGVAYIHVAEAADTYAQKKKLFVIKATGSSASIVNPSGFKPQKF
ncbi:MAG: hypothetical protein ACR2PY_05505 [Salinispira sp.]